jgi:serine/threonine protein kinase
MEFVEGETLADRIARGAIPMDDALPIARQIADALEAAHDHGIIHRDLTPANVKMRPDGTVKVLDFGLAKTVTDAAGGSDSSRRGEMANSPTITTPAMTHRGVILGTAAYMAPELAKGRAVDRRVDIWAFGCVLFEMLTAMRAFAGEDVSDTLVAILRDDPDWRALPAGVPAPVHRLLRRCLQKDTQKRLPHIGIARIELTEDDLESDEQRAQPHAYRRVIDRVAWTLAGALIAALVWYTMRPPAEDAARSTAVRFEIAPPEGGIFPGPAVCLASRSLPTARASSIRRRRWTSRRNSGCADWTPSRAGRFPVPRPRRTSRSSSRSGRRMDAPSRSSTRLLTS